MMAVGTSVHAATCSNTCAAIAAALRGHPCRPTTIGQLVFVALPDASLYPDVSAICGPYARAAESRDAVTNTVAVVETADYDRAATFEHQRRLPSLRDSLLVDPATLGVTHITRQDEGGSRRDMTEAQDAFTEANSPGSGSPNRP